jgi:hypothetical protein
MNEVEKFTIQEMITRRYFIMNRFQLFQLQIIQNVQNVVGSKMADG